MPRPARAFAGPRPAGPDREIINAKPQARRLILEEAAGITGLHTRRHEAELKPKAAETNLTRLDDVTSQLETQLNSLKRQARQATKYKGLSGEIRGLRRWASMSTGARRRAPAARCRRPRRGDAPSPGPSTPALLPRKLRLRDDLGESRWPARAGSGARRGAAA
ncbi:MAG: hypothetical protein U1E16_04790 [Hyphomicrobiales bacterium]